MFEFIKRFLNPELPKRMIGNVAQSTSLTLTAPVRRGSEIRVETTNPALAVTDNMGNTYQRLVAEEWKAIAQKNGPLTVTVDWPTSEGNKTTIKEYR